MSSPSKQKHSKQHNFLNERYEELNQQNFTDKLICKTIGISSISLLRWKSKNGFLKPRPRKVTNFTQNEYEHLREQGLVDADICKVLDCDPRTLFRWKKNQGIESRHKKYPKTPRILPSDCQQYIKDLYPFVEKIRVSDVKSLATERLLRSAYIFYCKANDEKPLSPEMQKRYFSKVIRFCFLEFKIQKAGTMERFDTNNKLVGSGK